MNTKKNNQIVKRLLFVILSSAIVVFFSEKTFWYVQGFAIGELVLFYVLPVAACLAVIDLFRVRSLSGMILVGGLLGFLVEGILTPVVYEAGLFDPVMPAYFVGWHGLLSLVFGWYWIRKTLLEKDWKKLGLGSMLFGLFWGIWSLSYRLPESILEFESYVQAGETWFPGAWPVMDFAFYTLTFSGMLIFAHWLLGRGIWQSNFSLRRWEWSLLLVALGFIFIFQVFPVVPLGIFKLMVLILLVVLPIRIQKNNMDYPPILNKLEGNFPFSTTLPLLLIPFTASLVYGLAAIFPPPENLIRIVFQTIYVLQGLIGGLTFIWAWVDTFRKAKYNSKKVTV
jgi:hypothetical protein